MTTTMKTSNQHKRKTILAWIISAMHSYVFLVVTVATTTTIFITFWFAFRIKLRKRYGILRFLFVCFFFVKFADRARESGPCDTGYKENRIVSWFQREQHTTTTKTIKNNQQKEKKFVLFYYTVRLVSAKESNTIHSS